MENSNGFLKPEERAKLDGYVPRPPPPTRMKRKGSRIVAGVVNEMQTAGSTEVSGWDIEDRLRHAGLLGRWSFKQDAEDDRGPRRTFADVLGKHCLQLPELRTERGTGKVFSIPVNGIDEEWLRSHQIELTD